MTTSGKSPTGWVLLLILFIYFVVPGATVKQEDFKTCAQSGFCKRNREYADSASAKGSSWISPYQLEPDTIRFENGRLQGMVIKSTSGNEKVRLPLVISFLESGVARFTLDEERRMNKEIELRHGSHARKERYNEASKWALVGGLEISTSAVFNTESKEGFTTVVYGPKQNFRAIIRHAPLEIQFQRDEETHVQFNSRGFLNVEHWRMKGAQGEDGNMWWEESFGGNTDSKPKGPESVGLDITFPGYRHVFGIPEHADSISLKETRGGNGKHNEPYRLYNTDTFEYILDSPMALYGSIPFMQAHRKGSTVGIFWLNAAETWVDIVKFKSSPNPLAFGIDSKMSTQTHWFSESGQLDVFVFLGPKPQDVAKLYGELTGFTQLPQYFSMGYHQCRWNYMTDDDVKSVDRQFDKYQIPYDVIWLDIEYTDQKKYFTWDPLTFPDPLGMQKQLGASDRKLVIIIDPHIKIAHDYSVVDELKRHGLAVKNKDGNLYEGSCWPGPSHWVDCFNPAALEWWIEKFKYENFKGTGSNAFIWNDMNEPAVFNGPETTMPRDNLHHSNWEHRDIHNINGLTFVNATYHAMLERKQGMVRRPFVLTRSFYAGSQRFGAVWTGDNQASWDHLAASIPMILNNGIAGFPYAGADVGGYFGNPSKELLTRWYQTGIFYPFFRGHSHIDTHRRKPYMAGDPYMTIIAQAIRLRYQLLPAWYTAFHEASVDGSPILRPQYYVHPSDEQGFAIDDQMYLGSTGLLAKPVVTEGAKSVEVYIADDENYYDYFDYTTYQGAGKKHSVVAPLEKIPLLMRAGHIIPRKDRPRRSSGLMKWDPYTLIVVLDRKGYASGSLYEDDGETFDFRSGAYIHRRFIFSGSKLSSEDIGVNSTTMVDYVGKMADVRIERIIVVSAPKEWEGKAAVLVFGKGVGSGAMGTAAVMEVHPQKDGKAAYAVIKKPNVGIGRTWIIDFS